MKKRTTTCLAAAALLWSASAQAQESLLAGKNATEGKTDVANEGFEKVDVPSTENDVTELKLAAGGLMATGNSRSMAGTATGKARIRRKQNQYSADVAANYAESAPDLESDREVTVENYQGRIRYDRFLSERWALFAAESFRRDRFQGLGLRMNFDPGLAFYVMTVPKHRLWLEGGYDLQYDIRLDEAIEAAAAAGTEVTKTEVRHAARAFAGYDNSLNEHVTFYTGLEYLQAFADTRNWRLNWETSLTSSLSSKFSLATSFNLRYDNNPLPEVQKLDTVSAVNLVYTLR